MNNKARVKTILLLAANPRDTSKLQLDVEVREIDEGLQRANKRDEFDLKQKWAVRSRDFYRAILDTQPQIVHFCGHGTAEDGIILENETKQTVYVQADALASMFKLFARKGVECVVLNACYSEVQAEAISQYVKYVIGMNKAVGDKAAVAFAVAFYDALGAGEDVEFAYELGCTQMMGFLEHQTPVLKKNELTDVSTTFETDVIPPNPYQGLSAFGEEDAAFFFGRETFVNELVQTTRKQPLVGVVGPSGSGKSSIVFAGLIPQLRSEGNWLISSFRPGNQPFYQLACALVRLLEPELSETGLLREAAGLAGDMQSSRITLQQVAYSIKERNGGKRLLLVADQFEELYTLCQKEEQESFADAILSAISPEMTLVFTLRADFYGYVLSYRPFRDALQEFTPQLLSSMKREELKAAIALPAQKLEVQLEGQLTQRILDDVGQEPGNLPLLEFALTRLWEKQQNRVLTHQAYDEIGGVKKAIANHAELVYQQLNESQQKQAERIFVQLVRPGEGTEDTRRIATRAEVGKDNWGLVSYLAGYQARLVVTGGDLTPLPPSLQGKGETDSQSPSPRRGGVGGEVSPEDTVEVVHEALIREWETLREWINANRQFRTWQERLKVGLREWKNSDRNYGAFLRGAPLAVAEDWLHKRGEEMTQEERDFIAVSRQQRDTEKQQEKRRRQQTIFGLTGGFVGALILAGFGFWQLQQAQQNQLGQIEALAMYSTELFNQGKKFDALIEALRSAKPLRSKHNPPLQVVGTLLNAVYNVKERNRLQGHSESVNSVAFSPDGKTLASGSSDKTIKLWDVATGSPKQTLTGHSEWVNSVAFSPDGKTLASGSGDKTIKLWDVATGKLSQTLTGDRNLVFSVAFSPDGKTLASGSEDKTIKLWDVATGKLSQTLTGHRNVVISVAFSPDGKTLASGSEDKTIKLWDVATGKLSQTLTGHSVAFSPDGKALASGSEDKTIKLWDVATGKLSQTLSGHSESVNSVAFSPDGKTLASGSWDKTIKLWDVATGKLSQTLTGHSEYVRSVAFSPDGKTLASGSEGNTIKLWDVATGKLSQTLTRHSESVNSVAFSPDGKTLASGSADSTIKLWDVATGKLSQTLTGDRSGVISVAFSPDGKTLASGSADSTIKLWDVATGKLSQTLTGHSNVVYSVAFSPDGKTLASSSEDKTIKLWDVATGKLSQTLTGDRSGVISVAFSPDGKTLASGSADSTIKLWDVATGKLSQTLTGHSNIVKSVAFSPDGKTLASSEDKTIKLWDVATGNLKQTLTEDSDGVNSVPFSPDGKTLASSEDKTIKLWDVATGKLSQTLSGHSHAVNSVAFSPDGKTLASGSYDKTVILWNLDLDNLMVRGCDWVRNYLQNNQTASENDKHLCDGVGSAK
ncbi:MAG: CHAT domain-containing protein [Spirirestis rafaelensis WJT71-NPBG6]|jgi:WD40 repeat protein/energy-coupling factor transporter ATP-binding protein EcfA2|nr:CHAT domain-containing protein [Spirirestis rafaelensis WJT71-NPBG6]